MAEEKAVQPDGAARGESARHFRFWLPFIGHEQRDNERGALFDRTMGAE